ncbi:MAG: class I SAM-dependent methyltransferase [Pseudomonadota bacterium]
MPAIPCPICKNTDGNLTLDQRAKVPTLQNVTLREPAAAKEFSTGEIEMEWCAKCSFVWNAAFDADLISYNAGYNNDVSYSAYYVAHLEAMADRVIASVPDDQPIHYLEIGCGEADFLKLVMDRANGRCVSAFGFDPSFASTDPLPDGAVVHRSFFGPDQLPLVPAATNVICSRHTIEHVPDVQSFVSALASPAQQGSRKLFIETPNVNWVLRQGAFQDFFYEHCSIYTPESMAAALAQQGMRATTTPVYGGQYMWTEAEAGVPEAAAPIDMTLAPSYIAQSNAMLDGWEQFLQEADGPVALWGGASKGVTFALLMAERGSAELTCAVDLNTAKQGCFMPVTGLPIVSPAKAQDMGVRNLIVMNPNYRDEIVDLVASMDWQAKITVLND